MTRGPSCRGDGKVGCGCPKDQRGSRGFSKAQPSKYSDISRYISNTTIMIWLLDYITSWSEVENFHPLFNHRRLRRHQDQAYR
jgi:hypothetical protein